MPTTHYLWPLKFEFHILFNVMKQHLSFGVFSNQLKPRNASLVHRLYKHRWGQVWPHPMLGHCSHQVLTTRPDRVHFPTAELESGEAGDLFKVTQRGGGESAFVPRVALALEAVGPFQLRQVGRKQGSAGGSGAA